MKLIISLILLFLLPTTGWACIELPDVPCVAKEITHFSFNDNDLVSWEAEIKNTPMTLLRKNEDGSTTEYWGKKEEPTITFHFKPKKAQELAEITKKIADPVHTENNLAIFYNEQLVTELRVHTPLPQTQNVALKISKEVYEKLVKTLPFEKSIPQSSKGI